MAKFNPLDYPVCTSRPLRLVAPLPWAEHIPFAMFLVDVVRPRTLVELGTHTGNSYSAFCQAVRQLGLNSRCYAVDTWEGDPQAGFYGPQILADLRAHHDPLYGDFSRLVQSTFDMAVHNFADASIDLLHIDGLHTYEAVRHDFDTWLPKVSDRGVIIMHDINVREGAFGVWKLWDEVKSKYPSFEFIHGHGLGVLAIGPNYPASLDILLKSPEEAPAIRQFFYQLGFGLEQDFNLQALSAQVAEKDRSILAYKVQMAEKEQELSQAYAAQVAEKERSTQADAAQAAYLKKALAEKQAHIQSLDLLVDSIYRSTSWKMTRPIRGARTFAGKIMLAVRSMLGRTDRIKSPAPAAPGSAELQNPDNQHAETVPLETPGVESKKKVEPSFPVTRIVDRKKISVIITSYDHERYIQQCLDSILDQKGNFELEIILGDDCSTDNTPEILQQYSETYPRIFKTMPKQANVGVTKNLKRCLDACQGDFIAICEGDDYWTDSFKLQKQMEFLEEHKDYSMCFSSFMIFNEDTNIESPFSDQNSLTKDVITTTDLILINYIGNFSCCMYRTEAVKKLPKEIFDVFTVDWMFNMACGEIGRIGFIRDFMSVYRKHSKGAWAGKSDVEQIETAVQLSDTYDQLFDYKYHDLFIEKKERLNKSASYYKDLLILDTIFPHPLSPFRYQEFISYLDHFQNSLVLTTGEQFPAVNERRSIGEVILEFENEHPEYRERTIVTSGNIEPYSAKLAYIVFLYNMRVFLESLENKRIPFIFTLYPGAGFELHKPRSDEFLARIFNSPQFRKVIVTQKITYDYLISKKLCNPDRVEFIFGVVTPLELIKPYYGKKYFGFEKDTLDICFVAHKYMPKGIDKGYDVFIEVARKLAVIHDNIHFHVVGSFTETDIPINGLEGRITFYGLQKKEWFDSFYLDKDIILSPNMPFKIVGVDGAFDGFPTASCTEAGLRNVAILCTDILQLNVKFADGEDIVIIPHDSDKIVDMINHLYSSPEKIKKIAENGSARIREIYSYANQISPRIKIIEQELEAIARGPRNG